jgi:hypothetical protein
MYPHTHTHTHTHTTQGVEARHTKGRHTHTNRHRHRKKNSERERERVRGTDTKTGWKTDRQTRQTDRKTNLPPLAGVGGSHTVVIPFDRRLPGAKEIHVPAQQQPHCY